MAVKKVKKEDAKTRYDDKNPTVSFRVSLEEYERLDALRKSGTPFREMVLRGAGMIEKDQAMEKEGRAAEKLRIEEAARAEALMSVWLGNCPKCGRSMLWDLTNANQRELLVKAIWRSNYSHARCPEG